MIFAGADGDRVDGGDGNDTLYGDDGDDLMIGGRGSDTMEGGQGSDRFEIGVYMFDGSDPGVAPDVITDLETDPLGHDVLDVSRAFAELGLHFATAQDAIDQGYLRVVSVGNGDALETQVQIAASGHGDGATWTAVAVVGVPSGDVGAWMFDV